MAVGGTATSPKRQSNGKHIPERTCVACRTGRPKRHLVRLVRTTERLLEVDKTGRKPGRGAYLCPARECFQMARVRKSLDHALEISVTPDMWQALETYAEGLPEKRL